MATKSKKEKAEPSGWFIWKKPGDTVIGTYEGVAFGIGLYGGVLFHIKEEGTKKAPGKVLSIAGTTILKRALLAVPVKSRVKIVFKGIETLRQKGRDGKPKKQFLFDVWIAGKKWVDPTL